MAQLKVVKDISSIVFLGSFNPTIFQPLWFSKHNLFHERYCNEAQIEVIHNEITRLKIDSLEVEVTRERANFRASDTSQYLQLRDLVIGVLDILIETPINQFGINRDFEFKIYDTDSWHHIGHKLLPKEPWMNRFQGLEQSSFGTKKVELQLVTPDDPTNVLNFNITPSKKDHVFFGVNRHFVLKDIIAKNKEFNVIAFINESYDNIWKEAESISNDIMSDLLK